MRLDPECIRAALPGNRFAAGLRVAVETGSTNDEALAAARAGAPHGWCLAAETQTRGRGRQGRGWSSPPGASLCLSALLRPHIPASFGGHLTLAAAVAAAKAVESLTGLRPGIKWPNDLLIDGRKLAGILAESAAHEGRLLYAVIGIGCNVNTEEGEFPEDLRRHAISLRQALGHPVDANDLLIRLLDEIDRIGSTPWEATRAAWRRRCVSLGQTVAVRTPHDAFRAVLEDVEADGAIRLRLDDGGARVCHSAEIL